MAKVFGTTGSSTEDETKSHSTTDLILKGVKRWETEHLSSQNQIPRKLDPDSEEYQLRETAARHARRRLPASNSEVFAS